MKKKVKALEVENETLKKKMKTHRFRIFVMGSIFGAGLTFITKNESMMNFIKKTVEKLDLKRFKKAKVEVDLEVDLDEETLEVLDENEEEFE